MKIKSNIAYILDMNATMSHARNMTKNKKLVTESFNNSRWILAMTGKASQYILQIVLALGLLSLVVSLIDFT